MRDKKVHAMDCKKKKSKSSGGSAPPPAKKAKVGSSDAANAPLNIRNKTRPWLASSLDDLEDEEEDE
jgi:hypothetical protein